MANDKQQGPGPLPYVSRRAVARVSDVLPIPTDCRYCEGPVDLVRNSHVYGTDHGRWPFLYRCDNCDAHVGLHPETDIPLGILADVHLRRARVVCKATFNELQKVLPVNRHRAYQILADAMGIPASECHFGWFDVDQCRKAADACEGLIQSYSLSDEVTP